MKRKLFLIIGCASALLGTIGAFVPLLPTVPLYLLATLCFARGSKRMHDRFVSTGLYQEHLRDYAQGQGIYLKVKLRIMLVVTLQFALGFAFMQHTPIGRGILIAAWAGLMTFFLFGIKNRKDT